MILLFLLLIYFSTIRQSETNLIDRFIVSFNNPKIIKKWKFLRYSRNKKFDESKDIMLHLTTKIRNILIRFENEDYEKFKTLIFNSLIPSFNNISFLYFETFVIIRSLQRILQIINNNMNIDKVMLRRDLSSLHKIFIKVPEDKLRYPKHHNIKQFYKKVILFEYACIYNDIIEIITIIPKKYIDPILILMLITGLSSAQYLIFKKIIINRTNEIIKYSRNLFDMILKIDRQQPISVLTSPVGISHSLKCSGIYTKLYMPYKYDRIVSDEVISNLDKNHTKRDFKTQLNIDYLFDKTRVYDRDSIEIFILLLHFYSVQNNEEYMYEFSLVENGLYKVKCSKYDIKEVLKSYYLKKDIPDDCNVEIINKFSPIINYDVQYSIQKSIDTMDEPITTRVIKLSCGHLLGFELISEWFCMFPHLKCHICMIDVIILGSFNADVFKCK